MTRLPNSYPTALLDLGGRLTPIEQHRIVRFRMADSLWVESMEDIRDSLMKNYGGHRFNRGWVVTRRYDVLRLLEDWRAKTQRRAQELDLCIEVMRGNTRDERAEAWFKYQLWRRGWRAPEAT